MELDAYDGVFLIREAILQKKRDEVFQMYIALLPNMKEHISFEEFFKKLHGAPKSKAEIRAEKEKTKEEIYDKVNNIFENYSFAGGGK